jgi:glycosyltransferase involved in cell wall biosynthesis
MAKIIIVWGMWGPYHCRRFEALRDLAARQGHHVTGVSLFSGSRHYQWSAQNLPAGVTHFNLGGDETRFPIKNIGRLLAIPRKLGTEVALLPSYDHWSLALNVAARLYGSRVVMMNDTHAGTARARGIKAAFKQKVVAGFHAGFVAGEPQRRYFASLGMPRAKIFTGYDAVDNDFFASRAAEIRSRQAEVRTQYQLPEHYFLSLGRFVAKKNLSILIQAYRKVLDSNRNCQTHLVMVGSGEEDPKLRALCQELRLPVYDKTGLADRLSGAESGPELPGVHFYGFRQIEENPVFYALADAFILSSLWEEWGLVVNEAMASGLPVVVSEEAGCAEDMLPPRQPGMPPGLPAELQARWTQLNGQTRQNGFLFDPKSSQSLAKVLVMVEGAPEIRKRMAQAGGRIVEKFSCENFAINALLAAQMALGKPGAAPGLIHP